jgi:hypothetical protein
MLTGHREGGRSLRDENHCCLGVGGSAQIQSLPHEQDACG